MRLKVLIPTHIVVDQEVSKVIAEGENGHFCLLPRHVDFVSALVPGLLLFESPEGEEAFLAVDEGVLVKCGSEVLVSARNAVKGIDLGTLRHTVDEQFRKLDDREKRSRLALARMEADLARRFLEIGKHG